MTSAAHESAHASAATLLGLDVLAAEVHADGGGWCWVLPSRDWPAVMVTTLMGHLQDRVPSWPPYGLGFEAWSPDGLELLRLADKHHVTDGDYRCVVAGALEVFHSPGYARLQPVIADVLDRDGFVDGDTIRRLAEGVTHGSADQRSAA